MASGQSKKSLRPKVGVAAIVIDNRNLLLGKRLTAHAHGFFGPPGGHLEFGESFERCAIRELEEETGIIAASAEFLTAVNTVYEREQRHYVVVFMLVKGVRGQEPQPMEPDKCASWDYYNFDQLPQPVMPGLQMFLDLGII